MSKNQRSGADNSAEEKAFCSVMIAGSNQFLKGEKIMKTEDIKTISVYHSAYDLLDAETILPELSEDFHSFLLNFDAFESIEYFCANGETVIVTDSCNGDVLEVCALSDILPEIMVQAEEDGIAV